MGACTSKSQVLKDAGEVPVEPPVPVVDDDAKRQTLDHLFKESNEGEKGCSRESVTDQAKQENANEANKQPQEENDQNTTKTPEPVAGPQPVEASETEKALPTDGLKSGNNVEAAPVEAAQPEKAPETDGSKPKNIVEAVQIEKAPETDGQKPEKNVEAVVGPADKIDEDKPAEAAVVETSNQEVAVHDSNENIAKPALAEATSTDVEALPAKVEVDDQKQENKETDKDDKKPEAEAPPLEVQENKKTDQEKQQPAPDEKKPFFKLWF